MREFERRVRREIAADRAAVRAVLSAGPKEWAELLAGDRIRSGAPPPEAWGLAVLLFRDWRRANPEAGVREARRASIVERDRYTPTELERAVRALRRGVLL